MLPQARYRDRRDEGYNHIEEKANSRGPGCTLKMRSVLERSTWRKQSFSLSISKAYPFIFLYAGPFSSKVST